MFESIKRGWALTKASYGVVRKTPDMWKLTWVAGILGFLLFVATSTAIGLAAFRTGSGAGLLVGLFLIYLVGYTILIYAKAMLTEMAAMKFAGQEPTMRDGFQAAWNRKFRILQWAIVAATVGLILQILYNMARNNKNDIMRIVGELAVNLVGAAWSLATFFVLPVLVHQDVGPFDAIRTSLATWKRAFGDSGWGYFVTGWVFFLVGLGGILLVFLGVVEGSAIGLGLILVGLAWIAAVSLVSTAVSAVLATGVYYYATVGQMPPQFQEHPVFGGAQPAVVRA